MSEHDTILIHTGGVPPRPTRGSGPAGGGYSELPIHVLQENISLFLQQIEVILENTPASAGEFKFTEFMISAEISANGKLVLLGSGVEAGARGALTFRFQKTASQ